MTSSPLQHPWTNQSLEKQNFADILIRGVWGQHAHINNRSNGGFECSQESSTAFKFGVGLALTPLYLFTIRYGSRVLNEGHSKRLAQLKDNIKPSFSEKLLGFTCFIVLLVNTYFKY